MHRLVAAAPQRQKHLRSYILASCTGREFVKHADKHGLIGDTVQKILGSAWDGMAASRAMHAGVFFNTHFQPQSVYYNVGKHIQMRMTMAQMTNTHLL